MGVKKVKRLVNRSNTLAQVHLHDYRVEQLKPNEFIVLGELDEDAIAYYDSMLSLSIVLETMSLIPEIHSDLIEEYLEDKEEPTEKAEEPSDENGELNYDSMSKEKIKGLLKEKNIEFNNTMTKAQLIELLRK